MELLSISQTKILGSSFAITRARVDGASVILPLSSLLFSVPPSRRKVLGAKPKQAGKKEGGWGGIPPAEPIVRKKSSDFVQNVPPGFTFSKIEYQKIKPKNTGTHPKKDITLKVKV